MVSGNLNRDESWVKSSYSGSSGGQCVEWAPGFASDEGSAHRDEHQRDEQPEFGLRDRS
ncbi:DUF397 domain-containing protein [Streptomyces sp. NPDC005955]|uniref:DUF397 domain-containing protein n=1 Tax=Streptomyces sp. NPDC005955 TaxID=3364738 RepID=UPI0036C2A6EC